MDAIVWRETPIRQRWRRGSGEVRECGRLVPLAIGPPSRRTPSTGMEFPLGSLNVRSLELVMPRACRRIERAKGSNHIEGRLPPDPPDRGAWGFPPRRRIVSKGDCCGARTGSPRRNVAATRGRENEAPMSGLSLDFFDGDVLEVGLLAGFPDAPVFEGSALCGPKRNRE